jgi:hypothetical protein
MKTQNEIIEAVKNGKGSQTIDGRDFSRLVEFFPITDLTVFGFTLNEGKTWTPKEWTEENIIAQLKQDVDFGFDKALGQRGISAGLMYEVVKMWMWVLDDPLQDHDSYAMYGLPLFKAVAVKYGFENPIGDDEGSEGKYDAQYD